MQTVTKRKLLQNLSSSGTRIFSQSCIDDGIADQMSGMNS